MEKGRIATDPETFKKLALSILPLIPWGKENAISRDKLSKDTGLPDRTIRDCIKYLSRSNPILSSSGHRGYWMSCDSAEIASFIAEDNHRLISGLENTMYHRIMYAMIKGGDMSRLIPDLDAAAERWIDQNNLKEIIPMEA